MSGLRIDPEFQALIPPLTPEEKAGLEAAIARDGCYAPLVVWFGDEILLDGHHRFEICARLRLPYKTTWRSFDTRDAAKEWVIRNQFGRRNLSPFQKIELRLKLTDILKSAAEARMLAGRADPDQNSAQGRVNEQIAEAVGMSHDTIHRARYLYEHADDATKDRLRTGETTIHAEYTRLKTPSRLLSSESTEWYTPGHFIEAARHVLGEIDLDPASCTQANQTVWAARYFDKEMDGLAQEWVGRVFLNPPYCRQQGPFTDKLIAEYQAGRTTAAIILVNAQATPTNWFAPLFDFPLCFPSGRINFESPTADKESATHGSVFAYLGPHEDRFIEVFSEFGPVVKRVDRGVRALRQGAA